MAVVTERWSGRRYQRKQSATKVFDVSDVANEREAANAVPFSQNSSHPLDANLRAEQPDAAPNGFGYWTVTVNFKYSEGGDEQPENPLDMLPELEWDFGETNEEVDRDAEGNPIVNSVGDAVDPPRSVPVDTIAFTIYKNLQSFDAQKALSFKNKCNAGTWNVLNMFTLADGQARCISICPTHKYTSEAEFVNVAFRFEAQKDGFNHRFLDQGERGYYYGDGNVATTGDFYYADGTPAGMVRLKGNGTPWNSEIRVTEKLKQPISSEMLPASAEPEQTGDAVFLKYPKHKKVNFNGLV